MAQSVVAVGALLLAAGCVHRGPSAAPPLLREADWSPPELSGQIIDGRFVDERFRFSVPVPDGWRAEAAAISDDTRVVMVDPEGRVRLRLSIGSGGPEPRSDCEWAFQDTAEPGRTATADARTRRFATCVPEDVDAPRILGWYADDTNPPVRIEAEAPPGYLLQAEDAAAFVLGGMGG